jgi:hypothetical protein
MEEINPWQAGRDGSPFLIDVIAFAWDVGVVADQDKRLCSGWRIFPRQLWAKIFAKTDMVVGVLNAKREIAGDTFPVFEAGTGQFHE